MIKKLLAILLTVTMLAVSVLPAYATGAEEFISDVALVYEDSVEDAKKAIEGTDWLLYEQDLNPDADYMFDDGVYLIYKTTTNVEEAITDLRVMDMYGGFSSSNYKRQLEQSKQQYAEISRVVRTAADEFSTLYNAGDTMAQFAHRQMNYYKDIGESDMLMGDFLLSIPSDEALTTVLMEGNTLVINNLIILLTIGISGYSADVTLSAKIAENYKIKDTLAANDYHEAAVILSEKLDTIRAKVLRYDALSEQIGLPSGELTEEQLKLATQGAATATALEKIPYGDGSLCDLVRANWTIEQLYPLAASLSDGQMALVGMGQLETILKYGTPSMPLDELEKLLEKAEADLTDENGVLQRVDVYIGVDRAVFEGDFAMTTAAERHQAQTGETWDMGKTLADTSIFYIASATLIALDVCLWVWFSTMSYTAVGEVYAWSWGVPKYTILSTAGGHADFLIYNSYAGTFWSAIGLALIAVGLAAISTWYNYYNPDYTAIPNVMIDIRETDIGDRYVKYTAAKVFGEGDKNADFNAYEGKEWIALYYTKDATAGNCLTPNFVTKQDNATVSRRHQGVSMFGETDAFNLNSHVYDGDAPTVYLSVRYSATKKAAADIPDVVGSMFGWGSFALSAGIGFAAGLGVMATAGSKKKKTAEA